MNMAHLVGWFTEAPDWQPETGNPVGFSYEKGRFLPANFAVNPSMDREKWVMKFHYHEWMIDGRLSFDLRLRVLCKQTWQPNSHHVRWLTDWFLGVVTAKFYYQRNPEYIGFGSFKYGAMMKNQVTMYFPSSVHLYLDLGVVETCL